MADIDDDLDKAAKEAKQLQKEIADLKGQQEEANRAKKHDDAVEWLDETAGTH